MITLIVWILETFKCKIIRARSGECPWPRYENTTAEAPRHTELRLVRSRPSLLPTPSPAHDLRLGFCEACFGALGYV
ncbi:hypothetical protein CDL15_Pgr004981 [Punica granatum]|nr:hypothetical protein CDL15_Pgr004981 [Punica granatum]